MKLMIILLALCADKLGWVSHQRYFGWFDAYLDWYRARFGGHALAFPKLFTLLALVLLLLLPVVLYVVMRDWLFGMVGFFVSLAALWYALGPEDLREQFHEAEAAGTVDAAGLLRAFDPYAKDVLQEHPEDPQQTVLKSLFWQAHERWFAVLLWFVLLGPVAALFYRLSQRFWERAIHEAEFANFLPGVDAIHQVLAWLPVRLSAMSMALAGNFIPAFEVWREHDWGYQSNLDMLVSVGRRALDTEGDLVSHVRDALALTERVLVIWIAFLAVATLVYLVY